MHLEHLAIWTTNLEALREFYVQNFQCTHGPRYSSPSRPFHSYFLSFPGGGARLELMEKPGLVDAEQPTPATERTGIAHFAIRVGNEADVRRITDRMRANGIRVESEPRRTGDGYFESVILDPDGNRIELTA